MKSKTIKKILSQKFSTFLESIEDENVRTLVKNNSIITGGSIASMLLKEEVNDYDVYFTNKKTVLAVCKYYIKVFNEKNTFHNFKIIDDCESDEKGRVLIRVMCEGGASEDQEKQENMGNDFPNPLIDVPENDDENDDENTLDNFDLSVNNKEDEDSTGKFRPVFISANAITLSDDFQLIIRFYGDADKIHENYDFDHCKCYWTSKDKHLELPAGALECLLTKELRYTGSKYPLASIIRTRKFIERGFTINAGQYLKMCLQLNNLNLRELSVLEDQLTGVDAYWFSCMLASVDADKLSDTENNDYVFNLIDRFF